MSSMSSSISAARAARSTSVALTLLLVAHAAFAVPPAQFRSAFAAFTQAAAGNGASIEPAADAFAALRQTEPANPVLMAYEGASVALKATTTWLPWKKMAYAEDGLALLDKALALVSPEHAAVLPNGPPAALEVRFVAANTFLAMPGFMNRGARGAKLLGDVMGSSLFVTSPLEFRGAVWLRAAKLATKDKRLDDARRYLNDVISSHAPQAPLALEQLKALAA
ncbi:hypothetical protein [Rhodoferax sp. UBA5149]|uniref:hypothetical protein n=1 Tax=Rhodoferax sp. UBA5149 TaxID=1947379 RepID=UPI0025E558D5|nr:hypothetical protein [Rhodoferax sp. UBA5149]